MKVSPSLLRYLRSANNAVSSQPSQALHHATRPIPTARTPLLQRFQSSFPRQPADSPGFVSLVDAPVQLVRANKRHGLGLIVLAIIPLTAFALGSWQVQRLGRKTELIARYEDRLVRDPLPLPPTIDPSVVKDFDYRRVWARGTLRHDQEILVGPRVHDGENGYSVITPLERRDASKILISRGWISKEKLQQSSRPLGVPSGEVVIEGLLREPFEKNMFTPDNKPEEGQWYFPDVAQMAAQSGSQAVWIEETFGQDMMGTLDRQAKGIPIGRPAEVNLRNNHTQYIFTWYALAAATSIMFYMVVKKPASGLKSRVRASKEW